MPFDTRSIGLTDDIAWEVGNDMAHREDGHRVLGMNNQMMFILAQSEDHPGVLFCAEPGKQASFLPFAWGSDEVGTLNCQVRFLGNGLGYCEYTPSPDQDTTDDAAGDGDKPTDHRDTPDESATNPGPHPGEDTVFVALLPEGASAANNGRQYRDVPVQLAMIAEDISCFANMDDFWASEASYLDPNDFGLGAATRATRARLKVPTFMSHGAFLAVMMGDANPYVIGAFTLGDVERRTQPMTGKDYLVSTIDTGRFTVPVYLPADAEELESQIRPGSIVAGTWLMTGLIPTIHEVLRQY